MQAPDLKTLLDFAGNWRRAAVDVARANGIDNIWTEMQLGNKTTPRVEVFFVLGEPTGHKTPIPGLSAKETPHDAYNATLTWSVISNRETNGAEHDSLCAAVRAIMLPFRHTFTDEILGYYELNGVIPGRNVEAVNRDNLDVTQMPYAIRFGIPLSSWPSFE